MFIYLEIQQMMCGYLLSIVNSFNMWVCVHVNIQLVYQGSDIPMFHLKNDLRKRNYQNPSIIETESFYTKVDHWPIQFAYCRLIGNNSPGFQIRVFSNSIWRCQIQLGTFCIKATISIGLQPFPGLGRIPPHTVRSGNRHSQKLCLDMT